LQPPRKGFVGAAVFESLDSRLRGNDKEAAFRTAPRADILPRSHRHCSSALYVQVPAFLQRTQVDLFDVNRYIPRCEKGSFSHLFDPIIHFGVRASLGNSLRPVLASSQY
jgi:hypothetical protein